MNDDNLPLLTQSQEMQLLADQDVGTMLNNIFENEVDLEQKVFIYEEDLLARQLLNENQHNTQELMYAVIPDILHTMNTNTMHNGHPSVPSLVSNEDYSGPYDFELYITSQTGNKNPWVYSMTLNKLFIAIATPFPIDFKCKWPGKNLFIRATPVFTLAQHSQDLVTRCITHSTPNDSSNKNVPEYVWNHVIRCQNSNASYHGSVDDNVRLSVILPLDMPQMGTDCVRVLFMFVCKNSCPSGMNRKPFEVVFTLEDEMGQVYGRHNLNVRVCSCPKRDKEKEEKIYAKENSGTAPPPWKKKKVLDKKGDHLVDTKEYPLPWNICGKQNQMLVLNYCYNLMAGELMQHGHDDNIKKCLDNLSKKRKLLE